MALQETLEATKVFSNVIGDSIDNVDLEWTNKNISAAGCFHIALEHHGAIALLVGEFHRGSASALVRPLFESVLRGAWLYECATEEEASGFLNDTDPPSPGKIVKLLEEKPFFKKMKISEIKNKIWSGLCSYTHSGGLHVTRRISPTEVVQNYSDEGVEEMLEVCNILALIAAYELCQMLKISKAATKIWESYCAVPKCP
jgi:hypothetical protein